MNISRKCLAMIAAVCACVFIIACGGSASGPAVESGSEGALSLDGLFVRISNALDEAYSELDEPPVNWDNMEQVKDLAFEQLTSTSAEPIWGAAWSLSVLDDHIAIWIEIEGEEKTGEWWP